MPRVLSPLDLNKGELRQAATHTLATASVPASPSLGQRYFDTGLKRERYYAGTPTGWVDDNGFLTYTAPPTGYTSDANAYVTITFPSAFKASTAVAVNVTNATPGNPFYLVVPYPNVTVNGFLVQVYGFGGNLIANNAGIVLMWTAVGQRP